MCRIPADKQVLLVSGGESLEGNVRVCQYSAAGTDTNPIFLFSKTTIESQTPPSPSINYGSGKGFHFHAVWFSYITRFFPSDYDMNEEVKIALKMLASYETVVKRTKLAQKFFDLAVDQTKVCEQLVHDQHLQQQGKLSNLTMINGIVNLNLQVGRLLSQTSRT
jgi:RB1-inducible coiled-coil protein 1